MFLLLRVLDCHNDFFFLTYGKLYTLFITFQILPDIRSPGMPELSSPESACTSGCNRYRGTLDVLYKVIRQVSAILNILKMVTRTNQVMRVQLYGRRMCSVCDRL